MRAELPEDFAITPANIQAQVHYAVLHCSSALLQGFSSKFALHSAQVSECERLLAPLLKPAPPLTDPEAARLGMKTEADEVKTDALIVLHFTG